jgi:hypothetical protein
MPNIALSGFFCRKYARFWYPVFYILRAGAADYNGINIEYCGETFQVHKAALSNTFVRFWYDWSKKE